MGRAGTQLTSGLLRFGTEREWLRFTDPEEKVTAWDIDEVIPSLERAEAATAAGKWVVGMLSYDAGPAFDEAVHSQRDDDTPLLAFGIFSAAEASSGPIDAPFEVGDWLPDQSEATYSASIDDVRELIAAGDTYQVNYTVRRHSTFWGSAEGLFASLVRAQNAKHDAFLHFGTHALCSASPELFFTRHIGPDGPVFSSRPMKGTRPRHFDPVRDAEMVDDLTSSLKDRAENVMIVDMVRNDLGRIADVGSVYVPNLLHVEHYPTVHAMTSTVEATSNASLAEAMTALYPVASITGAPKYRTTQIIADLEQSPRGAYCGSAFALSPDGRWEFNVIIRSVWLDLEAGTGTYGVGGGIVWDSEPANEWEETEHKSRVLTRAGKPLQLLETMAWTPEGGVSLRQQHINRLLSAGDHFGIDVDMDRVMELLNTVRSDTPVRLRLLVDAAGVPTLDVGSLPPETGTVRTLPIDTEPTDPYNEFLVFKTTTRNRYEEALDRFPDAPDVILWNRRGELTETCIANLVLEIGGELLTPHNDSGLLPGTLRQELLDRGQITERLLTLDDLYSADKVFTINSVRGWDVIQVRTKAP